MHVTLKRFDDFTIPKCPLKNHLLLYHITLDILGKKMSFQYKSNTCQNPNIADSMWDKNNKFLFCLNWMYVKCN